MRKGKELDKELIKLLALIAKYPGRRILPMVESDVVAGDEYDRWTGSIGRSREDSYCIINEEMYFEAKDMDTIQEMIIEEIYDETEAATGKRPNRERALDLLEYRLNDLDWVDVIVVDIDLPEML